ncbi:hypothetical protein TSUD_255350 [Trifolium subterraneum]|uniref:Uncharacterized protein n=2 Tax=Trifolium TaxID=3898 RepID=A0A2Z6MXW7_TRISU|nr:hypothetical protein TSUD_255350 [Trifolium subterraneum]
MKGRRTICPVFGSGKDIKALVPVICGEVGFMPNPTQPEGEMKVPKKINSKVELEMRKQYEEGSIGKVEGGRDKHETWCSGRIGLQLQC